jgi:hypothetical protein
MDATMTAELRALDALSAGIRSRRSEAKAVIRRYEDAAARTAAVTVALQLQDQRVLAFARGQVDAYTKAIALVRMAIDEGALT